MNNAYFENISFHVIEKKILVKKKFFLFFFFTLLVTANIYKCILYYVWQQCAFPRNCTCASLILVSQLTSLRE